MAFQILLLLGHLARDAGGAFCSVSKSLFTVILALLLEKEKYMLLQKQNNRNWLTTVK